MRSEIRVYDTNVFTCLSPKSCARIESDVLRKALFKSQCAHALRKTHLLAKDP